MNISKISQQNIPSNILKPIKRWNSILIIFFIIQIISWYIALFKIGSDTDQGNVYRILFVHVPVAWCAFFWVFFSAVFAGLALIKTNKAVIFDRSSHTAIEIGTVFSILTIITGSIWGRPTWGVWWDWDPRLTSSLVMLLICCGYLILRHFTPDVKTKRTVCAIVAILGLINIPIVYFSVNLWRSLHQPQTFIENSKNASSDISLVLFLNYIAMFILSIAIYKIRRQAISAQETLDAARGDE
ncbi:MAG: cytochrome C assembly protein [Spirobacillus cienkowskii]|jgi:heme exporter protein C|uniref:Heme exporter protein C n=1 Tax=Spirobacillus cienkowskii TaxID=495820 RepID=A0A369KP39_9BACT|nr:MAG: cytochrome C assembly protein [Spirobacillus cienkowskii]